MNRTLIYARTSLYRITTGPGEKMAVVPCASEGAELEHVVEEIQNLRSDGLSFSDIAVSIRAHGLEKGC